MIVTIRNDNTFKIALITEDVNGDHTAESFAKVCEQAVATLKAHNHLYAGGCNESQMLS